MAEHENCIGETDEWYTPPEIFSALGLTFDLDPCSPGPGHWVPARRVYTAADEGLNQSWQGTVFMNAPFGGRNGHFAMADQVSRPRRRLCDRAGLHKFGVVARPYAQRRDASIPAERPSSSVPMAALAARRGTGSYCWGWELRRAKRCGLGPKRGARVNDAA
jgi:hypothetical protein